MTFFFDGRGRLRDEQVARLRSDVSVLLLPDPPRALDLDRAYRAIVLEQGFAAGREVVLAPARSVYREAPVGEKTGIRVAVSASGLLGRSIRAPERAK
jgi:hypothetical protein